MLLVREVLENMHVGIDIDHRQSEEVTGYHIEHSVFIRPESC